MGLGTANSETGTYLSIAGGFIWNRKADESDPNYQTQSYDTNKKDEQGNVIKGSRSGARYDFFEGKVVGVEFKTHDEYGESINIVLQSGADRYIISISTNNRNSQDFMKALLKIDLEKSIYFKPYDFVDKSKKRAQGIVFRQDGEKIVLRNEDAPSKESDWFKKANKKEVRRFFEDLTEWYVAEIGEKVQPVFNNKAKTESNAEVNDIKVNDVEEVADKTEADETEATVQKTTPLQMRRFVKNYVSENYDGKELPKLDKEELIVWYNLSVDMEELPWPTQEATGEITESDLDAELGKLM
tara:strand:+ start:1185 stop:2081 length:897 start_codon:yes stop_codon:yes gene_type:complete